MNFTEKTEVELEEMLSKNAGGSPVWMLASDELSRRRSKKALALVWWSVVLAGVAALFSGIAVLDVVLRWLRRL
ncbi:MAG: hypothetical protein ACLQVJ_07215 [Syntrophobacteraceae bacterium]